MHGSNGLAVAYWIDHDTPARHQRRALHPFPPETDRRSRDRSLKSGPRRAWNGNVRRGKNLAGNGTTNWRPALGPRIATRTVGSARRRHGARVATPGAPCQAGPRAPSAANRVSRHCTRGPRGRQPAATARLTRRSRRHWEGPRGRTRTATRGRARVVRSIAGRPVRAAASPLPAYAVVTAWRSRGQPFDRVSRPSDEFPVLWWSLVGAVDPPWIAVG
ncbi:hypothetical protein BS78_02G296500 [Paspalum vaginatum]|nr:hypothetical protein BS78_02G296500 [Paspalum vaginatum]